MKLFLSETTDSQVMATPTNVNMILILIRSSHLIQLLLYHRLFLEIYQFFNICRVVNTLDFSWGSTNSSKFDSTFQTAYVLILGFSLPSYWFYLQKFSYLYCFDGVHKIKVYKLWKLFDSFENKRCQQSKLWPPFLSNHYH